MVAGPASIIWQVTHAPKHLGRQDDPVAQIVLFQKISGNSLAFPFVVHIGGIEKIDASVHSLLHDCKRLRFIRRTAEVHRSQTQRRDHHARATQLSVFHSTHPFKEVLD